MMMRLRAGPEGPAYCFFSPSPLLPLSPSFSYTPSAKSLKINEFRPGINSTIP